MQDFRHYSVVVIIVRYSDAAGYHSNLFVNIWNIPHTDDLYIKLHFHLLCNISKFFMLCKKWLK